MSENPQYLATFQPEAWINDYATPVDPEGPTQWNITADMAKVAEDNPSYISKILSEIETRGTAIEREDELRYLGSAPQWVSSWDGPYTLFIEQIEFGHSEYIDSSAAAEDQDGPEVEELSLKNQNSQPDVMATVYTVAWTGGYEDPQFVSFSDHTEAVEKYDEWSSDINEEDGDRVDLLKIETFSDGSVRTSHA